MFFKIVTGIIGAVAFRFLGQFFFVRHETCECKHAKSDDRVQTKPSQKKCYKIMPKPIAVRRSKKVAHSTNAHDRCECKVQFVDAKCCEFVRALIELSP